jgi:hypothetical protein
MSSVGVKLFNQGMLDFSDDFGILGPAQRTPPAAVALAGDEAQEDTASSAAKGENTIEHREPQAQQIPAQTWYCMECDAKFHWSASRTEHQEGRKHRAAVARLAAADQTQGTSQPAATVAAQQKRGGDGGGSSGAEGRRGGGRRRGKAAAGSAGTAAGAGRSEGERLFKATMLEDPWRGLLPPPPPPLATISPPPPPPALLTAPPPPPRADSRHQRSRAEAAQQFEKFEQLLADLGA